MLDMNRFRELENAPNVKRYLQIRDCKHTLSINVECVTCGKRTCGEVNIEEPDERKWDHIKRLYSEQPINPFILSVLKFGYEVYKEGELLRLEYREVHPRLAAAIEVDDNVYFRFEEGGGQ